MGIYKIGIIGPESTGKSTLASYLAHRYDGVLVPEYAREYMEKLAPTYEYTYEDVVHIARTQVEQLQALNTSADQNITKESSNDIVIFDTELIITKVWFLHKYGHCPDFVEEALHSYRMDVYLLCYPDMQWIPDPVRENPNIREYLFDWYEKEIKELDIPYYIIRHTNC
ncbi:MAG: ATP-binding protein [Paludibacteraceae bacterium]|nr:ATP-binding protein [Paludibacteraceae bacterium]